MQGTHLRRALAPSNWMFLVYSLYGRFVAPRQAGQPLRTMARSEALAFAGILLAYGGYMVVLRLVEVGALALPAELKIPVYLAGAWSAVIGIGYLDQVRSQRSTRFRSLYRQ